MSLSSFKVEPEEHGQKLQQNIFMQFEHYRGPLFGISGKRSLHSLQTRCQVSILQAFCGSQQFLQRLRFYAGPNLPERRIGY